jgi:hypothetical protein
MALMTRWRVIEYRSFYDVPRMIVASSDEGLFFFHSPSSDEIDDYAPHYEVYRLPMLDAALLPMSWENLEQQAVERRANIPLNNLPFTVERKSSAI